MRARPTPGKPTAGRLRKRHDSTGYPRLAGWIPRAEIACFDRGRPATADVACWEATLFFALPTVLLALLLLALIAGAAGCGLLVGRWHAAESRRCVTARPPAFHRAYG